MSTAATDLNKLVDQLSALTVIQAAELSKLLEEKWGVSAAAPVAAAAGAPVAEAAVEQTEFDVNMTDIGASKIEIIKIVREITGLGLKEAKDLVESAPPVKIKASVNKGEADSIKEKLTAAGAKVDIK